MREMERFIRFYEKQNSPQTKQFKRRKDHSMTQSHQGIKINDDYPRSKTTLLADESCKNPESPSRVEQLK